MSLTYTQKQYIQKHYPEKNIGELADDLGISSNKVQKHITKNARFFKKQSHTEEEGDTNVLLFSFEHIKPWFKANWINLLVLFIYVIIAYINAFGAQFVSDDIQVAQELISRLMDLLKGFIYWAG